MKRRTLKLFPDTSIRFPDDFPDDPFPGEPRLLFVGLAESTHTHAWVELLKEARLNVRMFSLPTARPPDHWPIRTYVTFPELGGLNPENRVYLHGYSEQRSLFERALKIPFQKRPMDDQFNAKVEEWLAHIISTWQPDVVQTLGLNWASYFFQKIRERYRLHSPPHWIVQVRGGPDLALNRLLPEHADRIRAVLQSCDQIIADNDLNYHLCLQMGVKEKQVAPLGMVPGTGGVDVAQLCQTWSATPSRRERLILWPKAYECPQSKGMPVLEALRLVWPRLQPCRVVFLMAIQAEMRMWLQTLPEEMRAGIEAHARVPREQVFKWMSQARIMLAPSLSDGIPNCLYEAMACGAFPIVSPLETMTPLVKAEQNVLFARNLYPEEIGAALVRALQEDDLVDTAAQNNLKLVRRVADRKVIGPQVIAYYRQLAGAA